MKYQASKGTVLVQVPVQLVDALLNMRSALDEHLASALEMSVNGTRPTTESPIGQVTPEISTPRRGGYAVEFLGVPFTARTLPEVFAGLWT